MSLLLAGRSEEAAAILEPLARLPIAPPRVITNLAIARAAFRNGDGARSLLDGDGKSGGIDTVMQALPGGATPGRR
ncbi:hypothetical protein [Dankookia sp. GCM10030260]|uniref:hypothetical protein n=1 Tax=Dankookia sp. GCM10030260 TaxID=3273390 RepID=UPI0036D2FA43